VNSAAWVRMQEDSSVGSNARRWLRPNKSERERVGAQAVYIESEGAEGA
jgi:hypothetical protein